MEVMVWRRWSGGGGDGGEVEEMVWRTDQRMYSWPKHSLTLK